MKPSSRPWAKRRLIVAALTLASSTLLAASSIAGTVSSAKILRIGFGADEVKAYVILDVSIANPSACVNTPNVVGFVHDSPKGRAMLSALMAAYLAGKRLNAVTGPVQPDDVCMLIPGTSSFATEELKELVIKD